MSMDTIKTIADLSKLNGSARNVTVSLTPSEQRLIAAAPELLEALRAVVGLSGLGMAKKFQHEMSEAETIEHAIALIAKATGGAE